MFVLLLLSWLSVAYTEVPTVKGLLYGIQPVVVAIVLDAILQVGQRTLGHALLMGFATAAFVAIFVARLPYPLVIGRAAGWAGGQATVPGGLPGAGPRTGQRRRARPRTTRPCLSPARPRTTRPGPSRARRRSRPAVRPCG
jgi:chromate transporter